MSLIEKAFLKVCGGYDFLGSNSSIDLHMLTGWVPEEIKIKRKIVSVSGGSRPEDVTFDTEKWWVKIRDGSDLGQCLITIGTGEMSDDMSDKLGLVSCHAYAILGLWMTDDEEWMMSSRMYSNCIIINYFIFKICISIIHHPISITHQM